VRSVPEFFLVALIVTLTPGPATATIVRVAARDGRRAAFGAILGNSVGVLLWGCLSAVGVASLVTASEVAYTALRVAGALVLVVLGARSLLRHKEQTDDAPARRLPKVSGWRAGLLTSVTNPKLAVFFIALFPQFLRPHADPLLYALAMACTIVGFDLVWYSALSWAVNGARKLLAPRVQRAMERVTGAVLIGLGVRLAAEVR
jgi:threonine/homoserine/homoserine lactone efflux protein